jgi:adenylyltransferase/sulfurtransferase
MMDSRSSARSPLDPRRRLLAGKRAAIVGVGGLGAPLIEALARAGVGSLTLIDGDRVDLSNLPRQVLFEADDVGRPKVEVAAAAAKRLAPAAVVTPVDRFLDEANGAEILRGHDVICDGTDSLEAKFLLNDLALALDIPAVLAGVVRADGQVFTVLPGACACYRCLFEGLPDDPGPTCAQAGVLGPLVGQVGALQATEALRVLSGEPARLAGALTALDAFSGRSRRVSVPRDPGCAACGHLPTADRLDITGETCPMTFVHTLTALEALAPGAWLAVEMRQGEPARNVPMSLREHGFPPAATANAPGERFRLWVRNRRAGVDP